MKLPFRVHWEKLIPWFFIGFGVGIIWGWTGVGILCLIYGGVQVLAEIIAS